MEVPAVIIPGGAMQLGTTSLLGVALAFARVSSEVHARGSMATTSVVMIMSVLISVPSALW